MKRIFANVMKLLKDESGAALVEYTVLTGILMIALMLTILAVGSWVNNKWTVLNSNLAGH